MPTSLTILSRCIFTIDYGTIKCQAKLMSDGTIQGTGCNDPCSFMMQKSGSGYPPLNYKYKLFAGDIEVPNQNWKEK